MNTIDLIGMSILGLLNIAFNIKIYLDMKKSDAIFDEKIGKIREGIEIDNHDHEIYR